MSKKRNQSALFAYYFYPEKHEKFGGRRVEGAGLKLGSLKIYIIDLKRAEKLMGLKKSMG